MKKIVINQNTCIGCGTCASLAPGSFKIGDNGKAMSVEPSVDSQEAIQNAIDSCPVTAISWQA